MQKGFEINNNPNAIKHILSQLKSDKHLSKTFEGTAFNGNLIGFYTNLALINGMVIGYVKIKGTYDLKSGWLQIRTVPSLLFWLVLLFCIIGGSVMLYIGFKNDSLEKFGALFFMFMALGISIAYIIESSSFFKQIRRVSTLI